MMDWVRKFQFFFEITFDMSRGTVEYQVLQIPYVTLCYTTFLST